MNTDGNKPNLHYNILSINNLPPSPSTNPIYIFCQKVSKVASYAVVLLNCHAFLLQRFRDAPCHALLPQRLCDKSKDITPEVFELWSGGDFVFCELQLLVCNQLAIYCKEKMRRPIFFSERVHPLLFIICFKNCMRTVLQSEMVPKHQHHRIIPFLALKTC